MNTKSSSSFRLLLAATTAALLFVVVVLPACPAGPNDEAPTCEQNGGCCAIVPPDRCCPCNDFGCLLGNCVFAINYSEEGCEESKSALALNAYLQYENYTISATKEMACAEAMMCRIDPNNQEACPPDMMAEFDVQLKIEPTTGNIVNLLGSNSSRPQGPDVCLPSRRWYKDCYWSYWTLDDLRTQPEIMANDNPADLAMMENYAYLAYYEDDACTDLASVVPTATGMTLEFPPASNSQLSCQLQAMCAVDPESAACSAIRDANAEVAQVNLETRVDTTTGAVDVYECDTSNAAAGQDECALKTPSDCVQSSIYSNCHFRYLSGNTLAQNPRFLVGEVDATTDTPPDEDEGEMDGPDDTVPPSGEEEGGAGDESTTSSANDTFVSFLNGAIGTIVAGSI